MDLNHLLASEQVSLLRAQREPAGAARSRHFAAAAEAGVRIRLTAYPHRVPTQGVDTAVQIRRTADDEKPNTALSTAQVVRNAAQQASSLPIGNARGTKGAGTRG